MDRLKILHISNGFLGLTKVHRFLYSTLDRLKIQQTIFAVNRKNKSQRREMELDFSVEESKIIYSRFLKSYHKFLFFNKANYLYKDILSQTNIENIDLTHATTLFTDGVLAFKLYKQYDIKYIVTVRNTDLNIFLKYRKDLYPLMHQILSHADKVVFLSEAYRKLFFTNSSIRKVGKNYTDKTIVLSNGIDDFWLSNIYPKKQISPSKLLFVGRIAKGKNLVRLIEAVIELRKSKKDIKLTIVGGKGDDSEKVMQLVNKHPECIEYLGQINCKKQLLEIYRENHIFTMPSLTETFGLVYIEAITQGLPVLFTKNQGIDGVFIDGTIGEKVDAKSVNDIVLGLGKIISNYNSYDLSMIDYSRFNWVEIANKYRQIYNQVLNKK